MPVYLSVFSTQRGSHWQSLEARAAGQTSGMDFAIQDYYNRRHPDAIRKNKEEEMGRCVAQWIRTVAGLRRLLD